MGKAGAARAKHELEEWRSGDRFAARDSRIPPISGFGIRDSGFAHPKSNFEIRDSGLGIRESQITCSRSFSGSRLNWKLILFHAFTVTSMLIHVETCTFSFVAYFTFWVLPGTDSVRCDRSRRNWLRSRRRSQTSRRSKRNWSKALRQRSD